MPTTISISGACVVLTITGCLALVAFVFRNRRQKIGTAHLRGRSLRTVREAHALLEQTRPTDDPGLQLGRLRVPS